MLNQFVTFVLNEQRYALPLESVQRVVRMAETTPLPKAPDIVLGVIDLRGQIVPVLSMRKRFGLPEPEPNLNDQLLVADTTTRTVALVVNLVTGVIERTAEEITDPQCIVPGAEYVEGIAKLKDGLLLIHNLDRFLSQQEEHQLHKVLAQQAGRA
jgi:purine-binding chemotaxis protein CheW